MKGQPSFPIQKCRLIAAFRNLLLIKVLFGFYNNCFSLKFVRCFARVYCIIVCSALYSYMFTEYKRLSYFDMCAIIQWLANVLVSLVTGEEYFFQFCEGINQIDVRLKQTELILNPSQSRGIFLGLLSLKCSILILQTAAWIAGYFQYSAWLHLFTVSYIWTALNMSHMMKFIIFEITSQRVKILGNFFECNLGKTCPRKQDSSSHTKKIIKEGMVIYKCLHENLKTTVATVKLLVTVSLCSNFVNMLVHCYDILDSATSHGLNVWIVILEHGIGCILCCLPTLFTKKTEQEVEKIKVVFEDELLLCNDAGLQMMIEDSAHYLTLCPIKNTISRAFSFDMNLPFIFFSLFTTYIIVIIQISLRSE